MEASSTARTPSRAELVLWPVRHILTCWADLDGNGAKEYPMFFLMEYLLRIVRKKSDVKPGEDKIGRFLLNDAQIGLYSEMCKQAVAGRPIRFNVLKARQIGFSTFIAGYFFIKTAFTRNFKSVIVADKKEHATNIFSKYRFFYQHLDDANPYSSEIRRFDNEHKYKVTHKMSWKPALSYSRGQEYLEFAQTGSILEVIVAGEGAGRSDTYDAVHLSECAFFQGNLEETINGISETVPFAPDTYVFMETTANGFNEYKDIWDSDVSSGGDPYVAYFVPWFNNQAYRIALKEGEGMPQIDDWLLERQRIYGLSDSQILWYWRKFCEKHKNRLNTLQEYPFCAVDAFISTGECVFGSDLVAERKEFAAQHPPISRGHFTFHKEFSPDGSFIKLSNIEWHESRSGLIKIYQQPKPGYPYVGLLDPNDEGSDFNAAQMMDNTNGHQVACFKTNDLNHDEITYQFYCLGRYYNWALLSPENNRGKDCIMYLTKLRYPKIYITQNSVGDDIYQSVRSRFGHNVNKGNRNTLLSDFKIAFMEDPEMIADYDTLCEMESFQKAKKTARNGSVVFKDEAAPGKHDDLIMSLSAFYTVRVQQTFSVLKEQANDKRDMSEAELEKVITERRRGLSQRKEMKSDTGILW